MPDNFNLDLQLFQHGVVGSEPFGHVWVISCMAKVYERWEGYWVGLSGIAGWRDMVKMSFTNMMIDTVLGF